MIFLRLKIGTIFSLGRSGSDHSVTQLRIPEKLNSQRKILGCHRNIVVNKDMELVVFGVSSTHGPYRGADWLLG